MRETDLLIVGAGTAGLTAAIYGCRSGLVCVVLEKGMFGGQIVNTTDIENYPGMPGVDGVEFANALHQQAEKLGAQILFESLEEITKGEDHWFYVKTSGGAFRAKAVIVANGAEHRKLGCQGEETFAGRGVSYCATCDGAFYRGKEVAVVGGGNTALEEALYLSSICEKAHLIHRRDTFRAHQKTIQRVLSTPNIIPHYQSAVVRVEGNTKLQSLILSTPEGETTVAVAGLFVAIGLAPQNQLYASLCQLDENGYFVAGEDCVTSCEGLYAAGDTRQKPLRQLVTAASDGAVAAYMAGSYIGGTFSQWDARGSLYQRLF